MTYIFRSYSCGSLGGGKDSFAGNTVFHSQSFDSVFKDEGKQIQEYQIVFLSSSNLSMDLEWDETDLHREERPSECTMSQGNPGFGQAVTGYPFQALSTIEQEAAESPKSSEGGKCPLWRIFSAILKIAAAIFIMRVLQIGYRIVVRNYGNPLQKWSFPFSINSSLWHHLGNGNPRLYLRSVYQWCTGHHSSS